MAAPQKIFPYQIPGTCEWFPAWEGSWQRDLIQVSPKHSASILTGDGTGEDTQRRPRKDRGRACSDVMRSQGSQALLTGTRSWKRQEGCPLEPGSVKE